MPSILRCSEVTLRRQITVRDYLILYQKSKVYVILQYTLKAYYYILKKLLNNIFYFSIILFTLSKITVTYTQTLTHTKQTHTHTHTHTYKTNTHTHTHKQPSHTHSKEREREGEPRDTQKSQIGITPSPSS